MSNFSKPVSSVSELQNKVRFDQLQVIVDHEEDEPLNCELMDGGKGVVMVCRLIASSVLEGKVNVGDYILSVNGRSVNNREELFKLASKADPQLMLVVARPRDRRHQQQEKQERQQQQQKEEDGSVSLALDRSNKKVGLKKIASPYSQKKSTSLSCQQTTPSQKLPPPPLDLKELAASFGIPLKTDREYVVARISTSKAGKPLGLGIMHIARENIVIASSIQPNSVASEQFKLGDRFLAINNTKIIDPNQCKQLIVESKGDFNALIERPPNGMQTYAKQRQATPTSLKSSYTPPILSDPEHVLGEPLCGYDTAPVDVQNFILRQLPVLMKAFGTGSTRSSQREKTVQPTDRLKIEHDVHEHPIESDVAPGFFLRKPPKKM